MYRHSPRHYTCASTSSPDASTLPHISPVPQHLPRRRHSSAPLYPAAEVRRVFLDSLAHHPHLPHSLLRPSPVLPHNDPSLTFVNSGMVQFKPVFQVSFYRNLLLSWRGGV